MQTRIESGAIEQLTPKMRHQTLLWSLVKEAEGVAVDLGTAQREHFMRTCRDTSLLIVAGMLGGTLFLVPRDQVVTCFFIVLAIIGTLASMAWFFSARWREHAETVAGDMPAPGTPVRIGADGLTIGSNTAPWSDLEVKRVNLRKARRTYASFRRYYVEQLLLHVAGRPVVLDAAAITHGQQIVNTIFNRLVPEDPNPSWLWNLD